MAQADQLSTTRRSFLGGAVAVVPVATTASAGHAVPDAELIALGKKFDLMQQEFKATLQVFESMWEEHGRLMNAWLSQAKSKPGSDEIVAAGMRFSEEVGLAEARKRSPDPDDLLDRIDPGIPGDHGDTGNDAGRSLGKGSRGGVCCLGPLEQSRRRYGMGSSSLPQARRRRDRCCGGERRWEGVSPSL